MSNILSTEGLTKSFGSLVAVNALTMEVPQGAVYGLLGPNGSGKSTTLGMLLGVLLPTSGSYSWLGMGEKAELRKKVGSLLEQPNFYRHLSGKDNLRIVAQIKNAPESEVERALQAVGMQRASSALFRSYSTGMKMRLAIGSALIGNPEVLILDEPTNGLDPSGIAEMRELVKQLHAQGRTVIIASHLLDEVEKVCTHVLVMQKGLKRYEGTVQGLTDRHSEFYVLSLGAADNEALLRALSLVPEIPAAATKHAEHELLTLSMPAAYSPQWLNEQLARQNIYLSHLSVEKKSLEQEFFQLISETSSTHSADKIAN